MRSEPRYPSDGSTFRISQSSLETYLRCGLRYHLDRTSPHRRITVPIALGSAVAAAAKEDNRAKRLLGEALTLGETVELAVSAYDEETGRADVEVAGSRFELRQGREQTASAARSYGLEISPRLRDIEEAEEARVYPVDDFELVGTPDVVTAQGVGDLKTGRAWGPEGADRSRQLTTYGLLYHAARGRYPTHLWIDSLSRTSSGWRAARYWTHRTPEDYSATLALYVQVREAIDAGIALPAPEGAWYCAPKWCPHFHHCPAISGRRKETLCPR